MNLNLLPSAKGNKKGRLGSLALVWQPTLEKENSKIKPIKHRIKINLVSHSAS